MPKIKTYTDNIGITLEPYFLQHSAGKREETTEILKDLQDFTKRKIIAIDGTAYSSEIKTITDQNINNCPILLSSGIDGVILNTNKKAKVILAVADCAPIIAYHKSGEISGNFHAGYKGVAGVANEDLGIITNMVNQLQNLSNSNNLDDFIFYIGPTTGRTFELPKDYIEPMFSRVFKEYGLDKNKYFLKHKTDDTKVYLHLKMIIRDILAKHGKKIRLKTHLKEEKSFFDINETDSLNSEYPSYRLHTKEKNLKKTIRDFNKNHLNYCLYETKHQKSEFKKLIKKLGKYEIDHRLALILEN